ncbi:MAG: protein kinase [Gemmatimonadota bacterium]|nr:MAG: protein kinase [Gemmatimonadota bacterium]
MPEIHDRLKEALAGQYDIDREIGAGGMAIVYLAHDLKHERQVALKVLRPDLDVSADRFVREIKLAASLRHPHILPVHDSGTAAGLLYYVMPYAGGESLRERIDRVGGLAVSETLQIVREVAGALHHAHQRGVVHRDVKPGNILLEDGHAVVTDFGIAVMVDASGRERITGTGVAVGTPVYMSPEQIDGEAVIDARSDIYSLACVAYEMLTGAPPFAGPTPLAVLSRRLKGPIPPVARDDVPDTVGDVFSRALSLEVSQRYETTVEFATALADVFGGRIPLHQTASRTTAPIRSIAVLPFSNMSPDPDNEYFTDGITEDVINALSGIEELRVASRTSAFAFREKDLDVREIGTRLNVANVLEGSVRRHGNRLRVTAQLIDVSTGYHLWSEQYDREMSDVFTIQDEISCAIVETLKGTLATRTSQGLVRVRTEDIEAYNLYLKGRYFWNRRGDGLFRAREYFTAAIERDDSYAPAHSALADSYSLLGWYRALAPGEAFPTAKAEAMRAVALDGRLADGHTSLAFVHMMHDWDWARAESEFRRAMELNPGHATTHHWYAEYLMAMGRQDEAIEHSQRALELDPLGLIIHVLLGMAYYLARRPEESIAECLKTLEMDPQFTPTFIWLGQAYLQLGRHEEAIAAFEKEVALSPERPTTSAYLAAAHALAGDADRARELLDQLRDRATGAFVSCFDYALIHFALGEDDVGFHWLTCAYEERAPWLVWLGVDPMFDRVRPDPRLRALLQKMRLGAG